MYKLEVCYSDGEVNRYDLSYEAYLSLREQMLDPGTVSLIWDNSPGIYRIPLSGTAFCSVFEVPNETPV